jgi:hypothetical protein
LGLPPESLRASVVNVYSKYSKRKRRVVSRMERAASSSPRRG